MEGTENSRIHSHPSYYITHILVHPTDLPADNLVHHCNLSPLVCTSPGSCCTQCPLYFLHRTCCVCKIFSSAFHSHLENKINLKYELLTSVTMSDEYRLLQVGQPSLLPPLCEEQLQLAGNIVSQVAVGVIISCQAAFQGVNIQDVFKPEMKNVMSGAGYA